MYIIVATMIYIVFAQIGDVCFEVKMLGELGGLNFLPSLFLNQVEFLPLLDKCLCVVKRLFVGHFVFFGKQCGE